MIKCETLGMLDIAKINPVLTSENDVTNHSILTIDDVTYLISNTPSGDDYGKEDIVISAGNYLNGYDIKVWEGQKLVIDGKHITDGASVLATDDVLTVGNDGKLTKGEKPTSGVYFVVTDTGIGLTELAVKAKVMVA